jgi:hypothetical protein
VTHLRRPRSRTRSSRQPEPIITASFAGSGIAGPSLIVAAPAGPLLVVGEWPGDGLVAAEQAAGLPDNQGISSSPGARTRPGWNLCQPRAGTRAARASAPARRSGVDPLAEHDRHHVTLTCCSSSHSRSAGLCPATSAAHQENGTFAPIARTITLRARVGLAANFTSPGTPARGQRSLPAVHDPGRYNSLSISARPRLVRRMQ